MFQISVDSEFSAAHSLRGYRGRCEELHGHNWKVAVAVAGEKLDKTGMLIDFKQIKSRLNKILQGLDHKHLNALSYFKRINPVRNTKASRKENKISNGVNPTSENIAKYVYDKLKSKVPSLKSVTVWESEGSSATYYGK